MAKETEYSLQLVICNYLKLQYPDVLFRSDLGGIRLTLGLARKAKAIQHSKGFPDLFICEPREFINTQEVYKVYYGMFLEIKVDDVFRKNGNYVSSHVKEQDEVLAFLRSKGYFACFGIGFDKSKELIDKYLSLPVLR